MLKMKWQDWKNLSDADRREHESLFGFERRITKELSRELNSNIFTFIIAMSSALILILFSAILMVLIDQYGGEGSTEKVLDAIWALVKTASYFLYLFMAIMAITWLVFMANLMLAYKKEKDWLKQKQSRFWGVGHPFYTGKETSEEIERDEEE